MANKKVEISLSFLNENLDHAMNSLGLLNANFKMIGASLQQLGKNQSDKAISTLAKSTDKATVSTKGFSSVLEVLMRQELEHNTNLENLYVTGEKMAKQTSKKIQKNNAVLIQEQRVLDAARKIKTAYVERIATSEEMGKAFKLNSVTYEQFIQQERTEAEVIGFLAKQMVELQSARRVENALEKEFTATIKEGSAATRAQTAAKKEQEAALKKKEAADKKATATAKKAAQEAKEKAQVDKRVTAEVKKMTVAYDKLDNKYKRILASERKQIVSLQKTIAGMRAKAAATDKAKKAYSNFITNMTAGLFAMEMLYRWGRRIFSVFMRIGRAFMAAGKDYSEFIRIARSASFILKTDIATVTKAASQVTMLGITMKEAAQGLDEFGRAGYTAVDALQAYIPIATFAKAVNTNLGRATTLVTGAMKSFGFEAGDVWRIASGMTNAVYDSRNSFETLETAFSYAGASGAAFGQTFEGVLSAVMAFRDLGLKASTSGTVYRRALSRLGSATKPTRDAFAKLNKDITKFTVSSDRSFAQVIRNFAKLRVNMSELDFNNLMAKTIGPRFAAYMTKLVDATADARINLEEIEKKLVAKQDTLYNLTKYNMTTITHQLDTFTAVVERAKTLFFAKIDPIFTPYIAAFNFFTNKILDSWEEATKKLGLTTDKAFKEMTKEELITHFENFSKKVNTAMDNIINKMDELILFIFAYKDAMDFVINTTVVFVAAISAIGVAIAAMPSGVLAFGSRLILEFKILTQNFAEMGKLLPEGLKIGILEGWDSVLDTISDKVKEIKKAFDDLGWLGQQALTRTAGTSPDAIQKGFADALKSVNNLKAGSGEARTELEQLVKTTEELMKISNDKMRDEWENSSATKITKQFIGVLDGIQGAVAKYIKAGPVSGIMIKNLAKFRDILNDLKGTITPKVLEDAMTAANKRGVKDPVGGRDEDLNSKATEELTKAQKELLRIKGLMSRAMVGDDLFSEEFGTEVKLKLVEAGQESFDAMQNMKAQLGGEFDFLPEELAKGLNTMFEGVSGGAASILDNNIVKALTGQMQEEFEKVGGFLFNDPNEDKRIKLAMENLEQQTADWSDRVNNKLIQDEIDKAKRIQEERDKEIKAVDEHQKLSNQLVSKGAATRLETEAATMTELKEYQKLHNQELLALATVKADQDATRLKMVKDGFDEHWRSRLATLELSMQEEAALMDEMVANNENTTISMALAWEQVTKSWGSSREMMWDVMKDLASATQQGLSNILMSFFDKSKEIKDVLKDLGKAMLTTFISYLTKMLLQKLIFSKISAKMDQKEGSAQIAKNTALGNSGSWARAMESPGGPIQALAWGLTLTAMNSGIQSAALSAFTGANTSGGFFNGTGLAGVPGQYQGRDNRLVPVSSGEIIHNNEDSDAIREFAANGNTGGDTYHFNISTPNVEGFDTWFEGKFVKTINESGKAKQATKNALKRTG